MHRVKYISGQCPAGLFPPFQSTNLEPGYQYQKEQKMENQIEKVPVLRLTREGQESIELAVAREFPLTIILNGQELVTLLCTPRDMEYLAVGFLASEGFISSKDEIKKVTVDERRGVVRLETVADKDKGPAREVLFKRIITSGCGRGHLSTAPPMPPA